MPGIVQPLFLGRQNKNNYLFVSHTTQLHYMSSDTSKDMRSAVFRHQRRCA
jgi:glutamine phosphoribosylpyrophosphate amidotransferase